MANFDQYGRSVSTDQGSISGAPNGFSSTSALSGPASPSEWAFYVPAGAAGSADDVSLFVSALPSKAFIVDVRWITITGIAMSTVTLRDATAGGGNAYSSALASATAAATSITTSTSATAAASGSSLYLRRSDRGVAGVLIIEYIPTV